MKTHSSDGFVEKNSVELVVFAHGDPEDPHNWPKGRKIAIVAILCWLGFCAVFGSSSYAPGEVQIRELYGVNADVASTGLTVYVLGFALGPLLCPLSEMYGRKLPYMLSWPLFIAFIAPSAWVNNIVVIIVFRLLTGGAAGCALNNGFGVIADMYGRDPMVLQKAVGIYAFCCLSGPIFGSVVGFFVAAHSGTHLWVIRVHWFFVLALWPLVVIMPETHGPTILSRRARKLRKESTANANRYYAMAELLAREQSRVEEWKGHLGRPAGMLVWEPINQGAALWISLAYGIVYFFFEVFPDVFVVQKQVPYQLGGLPFLGIVIGMFIALATMPLAVRLTKNLQIPFVDPPGGTPVDSPEASLKVALLGCPLFPASLFWFAWTSKSGISWVAPTVAGIPFGYSMLNVFYAFSGYVTSTYKIYASSAQATNTCVRSVIASIFPIVAHPIVANLGTNWGVSLFGFLSIGLLPIPVLFVRYGKQLRARSRYAREAEEVIGATRAKESALVAQAAITSATATGGVEGGAGSESAFGRDEERSLKSHSESKSQLQEDAISPSSVSVSEPEPEAEKDETKAAGDEIEHETDGNLVITLSESYDDKTNVSDSESARNSGISDVHHRSPSLDHHENDAPESAIPPK